MLKVKVIDFVNDQIFELKSLIECEGDLLSDRDLIAVEAKLDLLKDILSLLESGVVEE